MREVIRNASGEALDFKAYEADMRHLIDTYIEADEPRKISPFDNIGLLDLIVKTGIANAINTQLGGLKGNKNAIAETIENNVRKKIIKEHLNDPAYYEKMSALLDEIIGRLSSATHHTAVALASLPMEIKGFGHIKLRHLAAASRVAHVNHVFQVEMFRHRGQVVGVMIHVVAAADLGRSSMAAPVMRDDAIAMA